MANIIEMPKLSDTMTVGTLIKWLKKEGDAVKSGSMLAEVETDKATMELESFFDGTLLKIFAAPGSQVPIGAPLCAIGKPGEKVEQPAGKPAATAPAKAATNSPSEDKEKAGASTASKNEVQAQPAAATPPPAKAAQVSDLPAAKAAPAREENERVRISPLARKLAEEKHLDITRITGSGPGGRIVRTDVIAADKAGTAKAGAASATSARDGASSATGSSGFFAKGPIQEERDVPVSNMRAAIARRLVESKTQLPHFYVELEIDAA